MVSISRAPLRVFRRGVEKVDNGGSDIGGSSETGSPIHGERVKDSEPASNVCQHPLQIKALKLKP